MGVHLATNSKRSDFDSDISNVLDGVANESTALEAVIKEMAY